MFSINGTLQPWWLIPSTNIDFHLPHNGSKGVYCMAKMNEGVNEYQVHNIIKIHNNVLWDWRYGVKYSSHLVWTMKYSTKYCQSQRTLSCIWIMLYDVQTIGIIFLRTKFDLDLHALTPKWSSSYWSILGFPLDQFYMLFLSSQIKSGVESFNKRSNWELSSQVHVHNILGQSNHISYVSWGLKSNSQPLGNKKKYLMRSFSMRPTKGD